MCENENDTENNWANFRWKLCTFSLIVLFVHHWKMSWIVRYASFFLFFSFNRPHPKYCFCWFSIGKSNISVRDLQHKIVLFVRYGDFGVWIVFVRRAKETAMPKETKHEIYVEHIALHSLRVTVVWHIFFSVVFVARWKYTQYRVCGHFKSNDTDQ